MKLDVYQMLIKCNVFQMIHSLTNVLRGVCMRTGYGPENVHSFLSGACTGMH